MFIFRARKGTLHAGVVKEVQICTHIDAGDKVKNEAVLVTVTGFRQEEEGQDGL